MPHDLNASCIEELIGHLGPLSHDVNGSNIPQALHSCAKGSPDARHAVFYRQAIFGLCSQGLEGMVVDGRIGLAGRLWEGVDGRENLIFLEESMQPSLFQTGVDPSQARGRHDRQGDVFEGVEFRQDLFGAGTSATFCLELLDHAFIMGFRIDIQLFPADVEFESLPESHEDATEAEAEEIDDQVLRRVSDRNALLLQDFVDEFTANLGRNVFRFDESIVAVE